MVKHGPWCVCWVYRGTASEELELLIAASGSSQFALEQEHSGVLCALALQLRLADAPDWKFLTRAQMLRVS
jgi:hypothetical protein